MIISLILEQKTWWNNWSYTSRYCEHSQVTLMIQYDKLTTIIFWSRSRFRVATPSCFWSKIWRQKQVSVCVRQDAPLRKQFSQVWQYSFIISWISMHYAIGLSVVCTVVPVKRFIMVPTYKQLYQCCNTVHVVSYFLPFFFFFE